jgi:hypothetical protein
MENTTMNQLGLYGALGVLSMLLSGCDPKTQNPTNGEKTPATAGSSTKAPMPSGITQKELDAVAGIVATADAPEYVLVEIGTGKDIPGDANALPGMVLVVRERNVLNTVADGALSDGNGSLVRIGAMEAGEASRIALNHLPEDHSAMMIDVDGDRIVDLAEWVDPMDRRWWLINKNSKRIEMACLEKRQLSKDMDITACLPKKSASAGSGAWAAQGFFDAERGSACGDNGIPDSIIKGNPRNPAAESSERRAAELIVERDQARANGNTSRAEALDRAASAHAGAAAALRAFEHIRNPTSADIQALAEALAAAQSADLAIGGPLPTPPPPPPPPPELIPPQPPRMDQNTPRHVTDVTPDPDSQAQSFEDPRCKLDAMPNNFLDKQYCDGEDPITCLARTNDPIKGATGGLCRTEPGPDGGSAIVCDRDMSPLDPSLPKPDYSPVDVPIPRPVRDDQRIFKGYVELTPLAGVIALRCRAAQGGICGGNP